MCRSICLAHIYICEVILIRNNQELSVQCFNYNMFKLMQFPWLQIDFLDVAERKKRLIEDREALREMLGEYSPSDHHREIGKISHQRARMYSHGILSISNRLQTCHVGAELKLSSKRVSPWRTSQNHFLWRAAPNFGERCGEEQKEPGN